MSLSIDLPCVPLCEITFRDPSDPSAKDRWVTKKVDFDMLVRQFQCIDHTYPLAPGDDPQAGDFDAIGARMAAYQEVLQGLAGHGPDPNKPVPPQTEGSLRALREALYRAYVARQEEEKKTAAPPPPPAGGGGSSSSAPSPSAPSSGATPPAGPAGAST